MNLKSMLIAPPNKSACTGGMCRHDHRCPDRHCEGNPLNGGNEAADTRLLQEHEARAAWEAINRHDDGYWPITSNAQIDTEEERGGMRLATWVALAVLTPFTAWLVWSGWQMWQSFIVSLQSIGIPVF